MKSSGSGRGIGRTPARRNDGSTSLPDPDRGVVTGFILLSVAWGALSDSETNSFQSHRPCFFQHWSGTGYCESTGNGLQSQRLIPTFWSRSTVHRAWCLVLLRITWRVEPEAERGVPSLYRKTSVADHRRTAGHRSKTDAALFRASGQGDRLQARICRALLFCKGVQTNHGQHPFCVHESARFFS